MKKLIICIILVCPLILGKFSLLHAQNTAIYTNPDNNYRLAKELFEKEKYGAALQKFTSVITSVNNPESSLQINAEYYAAFCALELFQDDAEYRLLNFVKNHPDNPKAKQAYFQIGKFQYRQKAYDKAIEAFEKVDIFNLNNEEFGEYYFKKGFSYYKTNQFEKAKADFYKIKDSDSGYAPSANYYYSHIAYLEKNYEAALKGFKQLENNETFKNIAPFYIVQIYYIQGDYEELLKTALPILDNEKSKKIPDIARLVGEAYFKTGKYKEALPYLEMYEDKTRNRVSPAEKYQLAYAYYKTSDYDKAIPLFQDLAYSNDSLTQNACYHLGECYIKTNQKQFARNAFYSAYKMIYYKDICEDALYNYAKLSYELGKNPFNEAIKSLKLYINQYPESPRVDELYVYLVNLFISTHNFKDAFTSLENIKVKDEKLKMAYQSITYNRGLELFNEGKYDEAIELLKKSLTLTYDKMLVANARYWIGEGYYRKRNYEEALSNYRTFLLLPGAYNSEMYGLVNYNIAYVYFKKKNYDDASINFRKYLTSKTKKDPKFVSDAYLRLADCYFINKKYADALENYDKVISSRIADADYALYQKSLVLGAQGNMKKKVATLEDLIANYKRSSYQGNAQYELGVTCLIMNNLEDAMTCFKKIVSELPHSVFARKAELKIGMIYYNNNQNELALQSLSDVVDNHPGTPEAKEALVTIKNIYIDMNRVDDYVAYTQKIPFSNVSTSEQDSISYMAAENLYMNGDCQASSQGFEKYIAKFPQGSFIVNANFYKAECDYKNNHSENALKGYEFVISQPLSKFSETSLLNAANIQFSLKNYQPALNEYRRLNETAENKANILEALTGMMRCYYLLHEYDTAIFVSEKLLGQDKLNDNLTNEANLTIGLAALATNNLSLAKTQFQDVAKNSRNETGAQAKYQLAYLLYVGENYKEAEKTVFELAEKFSSFDYWVAKGYILLSDVYVKLNNNFQAKQTLQSIIDNYDGDDLKTEAIKKFNTIIGQEKAANTPINNGNQ